MIKDSKTQRLRSLQPACSRDNFRRLQGTVDVARELAAQRREIQILFEAQPDGLGRAFRGGFDMVPSDTDFVVTMDADLNHQPEEIERLLAVARESGADIVVGSRRVERSKVEGMPVWKNTLSSSVNHAMHVLMSSDGIEGQ